MQVLRLLIDGKILLSAALSWMMAQLIKTMLTMIHTKRFVSERLLGAGGMPSAHTAAICALTWGVERKCGLQSPNFAMSLIFSFIVMYDAMGVRRAIGEHAKILNIIGDSQNAQKKCLKEHQGHTPLEVLAGAVLGSIVSLMIFYRIR